MTKYYVDVNGNYLGGFDGVEAPNGSVEVAQPPEHGLDIWTGSAWVKPLPTAEQLAIEAKQAKELALEALVVTTSSGKVFQGNETARVNMLSAITSAALIGQTSANWKLADNTTALVTLNEVKEALALSIQRVGEIVTA